MTHLFALAVAAAASGTVALLVSRFRLEADDYRHLVRALDDPWRWDEGLRLLSTNVPFAAAAAVGSRVPGGTLGGWGQALLAGLNVAALLATVIGLAALRRRLGGSWGAAALAGALFALGPGVANLLRWGSGLEQLGALACTFGALFAADCAARPAGTGGAGRLFWSLAVTMALLAGVFVKAPVMVAAPLAVWLWVRWVVTPSDRRWGHPLVLVGLATLVGAPMLAQVLDPAPGAGRSFAVAGTARLLLNLEIAAREFAGPLLRAGTALAALLVSARLVSGGWPRGAPLAPRERLGRLGPVAFCATFGAVLLAPYLLNGTYFASYYVSLAWGACALVVAPLLDAAARGCARAPWVALLAVPLLVPREDLAAAFADTPENRAPGFLAELAGALRGQPEPEAVLLRARCPDPGDTERSDADLERLLQAAGERAELHLITGWRRAELAFRDGPPGALAIEYCRGQALRAAAR